MAGAVRLLVASHDASRTGAPLLLLTFLRWLREHTTAEVQLVLWRGGPLVDAFAEVAEVTVIHPPPGTRSTAETIELGFEELRLGGVAERLRVRRVGRVLEVEEPDVRLLNGAGAALVLPYLPPAPSVAWVHELARGLTFSLRGPGRVPFLAAERVAVVADRVADELATSWAVPRQRMVLRPGCVPDRVPGPAGPPPPTGPLVASVGAGSWRKGVDLFGSVAAIVRRQRGDVTFAWVGAVDDDVDRSQLGDVVLAGEVGDPDPWFAAMDVFVSAAREDPFPLVALEAGAAGVPVVAFDSGGITELLADGRGTVVPPEDVEALAEAVLHRLEQPDAERLRAHVEAHHRIEVLGPALWDDLLDVVR